MKMTVVAWLAALGCGSIHAGTFLDDFNRSNTPATHAAAIAPTWVAGPGGQSLEDTDWAIWEGRLQFKDASSPFGEWQPSNYMYNTNAITTDGNFTLTAELWPNNQDLFDNALGVLWEIGDRDGDGENDEGFGIRIGDHTYQVVRMNNNSYDTQIVAGSFSPALEPGKGYLLTVTSSTTFEWIITFEEMGINAPPLISTFASQVPAPENWIPGVVSYGGVAYQASVWESSLDNFTVASPDAIAPPSAYDLWKQAYSIEAEAGTADHDNDGLSNIYEYGVGGDPTNAASWGISPTSALVGGDLAYVYPRLEFPVGVDYYLELSDSLNPAAWTNAGYTVEPVAGAFGPGFDAVTNLVPTAAKETSFVRLIIEEQP